MNDQGILALVDLVIDAIADGKAALADGKITILDMSKFTNLIPDVIAVFGSLALVPGEVKQLNPAQETFIIQHVMQKLGVTDTKAGQVAQAALKLAGDLYADIGAVITAIQSTPSQAV